MHGWPGLRARDLVRLAMLTATGGRSDSRGWPAAVHFSHGDPARPAVPHPFDTGVSLGTETTSGHRATAVVSLMRRGRLDVPAAGIEPANHVEVRLLDRSARDANPNLAFCLADTAAVIAELRRGPPVLVHCVAPSSEPRRWRVPTPSTWARPRGGPTDDAEALPRSRRRGRLWDLATRRLPRRGQLMSTLVDWLNRPAFTSFGAPTTWAEVLGFLTGAACV